MEKLTILFLTLLVTPLYGLDKAADKLDLTLPQTPFDYVQMNKDSKLIKDWEDRNRLNFFDVHPKPTKEQIKLFSNIIMKAGYPTPIRLTRGDDILAACGQLKSKTEKRRRSLLSSIN